MTYFRDINEHENPLQTFWRRLKDWFAYHILRLGRTPLCIQMDRMECGAVALKIILGFHKRHVPIEKLRTECDVGRDGSHAQNVIAVARSYGLDAQGAQIDTVEAFHQIKLPSIVHWGFNHFVVIEHIDHKHVYINDPAHGHQKITHLEVSQQFTGIALLMQPNANFVTGGQNNTLLSNLKALTVGSRAILTVLAILSLCFVITVAFQPAFTKLFIDYVVVNQNTSWFIPILMALGCFAIASTFIVFLQSFYFMKLHLKTMLMLSSNYLWHLLHLPLSFFTQRLSGDLQARLVAIVNISNFISRDFPMLPNLIFSLIVFGGVLYLLSPLLALILGISIVVIIGVTLAVLPILKQKTLELTQDTGQLNGRTMQMLKDIEQIKSNGQEAVAFEQWSGKLIHVVKNKNNVTKLTVVLQVMPEFLTILSGHIMLGMGVYSISLGYMTIGALLAFQSLSSRFTDPLMSLVGLSAKLQKVSADMFRIQDAFRHKVDPVIEAQFANPTPHKADTSLHSDFIGEVSAKNLVFGYSQNKLPLIQDVTISIGRAEQIAIVGPTGCGKSTLASLICGLYEPWQGEILFNGHSRQAYDRNLLAKDIMVVDQNISLFDGTLRDNLTMWDSSLTDDILIQALKDAHIYDTVNARGGLDQHLKFDGVEYSGGEIQRLEIARALAAQPKLLILDEATSAMDPYLEKQIYKSIQNRGCSTLIIAHRLSAIRESHKIYVMQNGQIIESGTFDKLKQKAGLFANLMAYEDGDEDFVSKMTSKEAADKKQKKTNKTKKTKPSNKDTD